MNGSEVDSEVEAIVPGFAGKKAILERADFPRLIEALQEQGYCVIGPTLRDGAIVFAELDSAESLPIGWTDLQEAGTYRLKRRDDAALFGYAVGPHSWKQFLFPPSTRLFRAQRAGRSFERVEEETQPPKFAFLGVRACDLNAIAIQDRVFLGKYADPTYQSRRESAFIVAVNCAVAGGTCFCVSMKTGPKAHSGFDLALTEILLPERHYFLVETGTETGQRILSKIPHRKAENADSWNAEAIVERTAGQMGRTMQADDIKELLYRNFEHPRWEEVAGRCLSCANCTLACPTCFCSNIEDVTDLSGDHAERWRKWDSCFTMAFTRLAGAGSVRSDNRSRYRQWMTHKLATWWDQFGTSGCVGCGRCITWCPVGIDITEEAKAIRETERRSTAEEGESSP